MPRPLETRKGVQDTAAEHQAKSTEKQRELGDTRADKETASATAKELNQAGTAEGREAVRKAMAQVGEKIDRHFEKRASEAEEISAEAGESAEVLDEAKEQTESDSKQIESAKQKLRERESGADEELARAADSAKEEAEFLAKMAVLEIEIKKDIENMRVREEEFLKKAEVKTK